MARRPQRREVVFGPRISLQQEQSTASANPRVRVQPIRSDPAWAGSHLRSRLASGRAPPRSACIQHWDEAETPAPEQTPELHATRAAPVEDEESASRGAMPHNAPTSAPSGGPT